jgi:peroxiredoxin
MCTLRDSISALKSLGAEIIGISMDGPFANKSFTENRHLNFPVVSDYKREVINKYGIVMSNLGPLTEYNAAKRCVFVLDEKGFIRYRWISDNPLIEPDYSEIRSAVQAC